MRRRARSCLLGSYRSRPLPPAKLFGYPLAVADRPLTGDRLKARARRLWRWLFPPRIEPPEEVKRLLQAVFPTLDLSPVSFHRGAPHLVRLLRAEAIVIPGLLRPRRTCIYVEPEAWEPGSVEGLGTLVHEAFHALQAQEVPRGFGPFRPYLLLYFAQGSANGFRYHGHPMENGAYDVAGLPGSRFETAFAAIEAAAITAAVEREGLRTPSSGLRFWSALAGSLPFAPPRALALPLVPLWLLLWTAAVALTWLGRLIVEGTGACVVALLWGCGVFISAIEPFLYRHT